MDFLNPKKKRAQMIRLYIGYTLMAIALGVGTLLLAFSAYGYGIDRETGTIIQNGLLTLDSHPEAADIFINGVSKGRTGHRLILPADHYEIELRSEGYHSWKHTVSLEGSTIEQLVYPVLFPTKLTSKPLREYPTPPTLASQSPDRRWLVVKSPAAKGEFQVIDLSNGKNPITAISLPDTLLATPATASFEAIEWASDNAHMLLKHNFEGGSEFVLLDRDNPATSVNLSKQFAAQPFTTITLRDKKADQFYLWNAADGNLFQADFRSGAPALLLSQVLTYKPYQADTLLYTTNPTKNPETVEVRVRQGTQDYLLRTLPIAQTYLLDMASFNGQLYVVSGSTADGRTYLYKNPLNDLKRTAPRTPQPLRVLIVPSAQYVSFSSNSRFVAVQAGSSFAVYDAETARQFRYDTKLTVAAWQKALWMDGHRLVLTSDNVVNVFDFDGMNLQKLGASLPTTTPFFSRDYEALFTFAPIANEPPKTTITRTELKVVPAGQTP